MFFWVCSVHWPWWFTEKLLGNGKRTEWSNFVLSLPYMWKIMAYLFGLEFNTSKKAENVVISVWIGLENKGNYCVGRIRVAWNVENLSFIWYSIEMFLLWNRFTLLLLLKFHFLYSPIMFPFVQLWHYHLTGKRFGC